MNIGKLFCLVAIGCLVLAGCSSSTDVEQTAKLPKKPESKTVTQVDKSGQVNTEVILSTTGELANPVRLKADGKPIDIGSLSNIAHAGPVIADVDCDGDKDLLVGDFPGYFWFFENENTDQDPRYTSKGKLQAGGEDARTPVY